jgi:hypothetical protein
MPSASILKISNMYKIILTLLLCSGALLGLAQTPMPNQALIPKKKYPFRDFTVEPALGTRLTSLMGQPDVQVSNLLQYKIKHKISFIAHTAISSDMEVPYIADVKKNYSYTFFQKFGVGASFNTRSTSNVFSILAGAKYHTYSATFDNKEITDQLTTKTKSFTSDYGLMYNLKSGKKKYFFSSRLYIPMKDGLGGIIENANIELGVGISLK